MIRATYKRKFYNHPELLQEMLTLRSQGWSFLALASKYQCDHSSIIYHCRKNGIKKFQEHYPNPVPVETENKHWQSAYAKIGNKGHNYEWYLKQDKLRQKSKAWKLVESFKK